MEAINSVAVADGVTETPSAGTVQAIFDGVHLGRAGTLPVGLARFSAA
ncbi:MAG: hypothetical protein ABIT01_14115 [Thermoanaerobaculia bacterium]